MSLPDVKLSEKYNESSTTTITGGVTYIIKQVAGIWSSFGITSANLAKGVLDTYRIVSSFTNSDLDGSYDLVITTPTCIAFEITIQKPDGTHMISAGLVEKTGPTQVKVHFGEAITAGTWYYILKYYTATT